MVGKRRTSRVELMRWALVAAAFCLASLIFSGVASASPDTQAQLSSYILQDPVLGWTPEPASAVSQITNRLEKLDSNAVGSGRVIAAGSIWRDHQSADLLAITLTKWPSNLGSWNRTMTVALDDECVAVTGNDPTSVTPATGLPGSKSTLCSSANGRSQLAVTVARKGDVVEMVEAVGIDGLPMGLVAVDGIASREYALLPAAPAASPLPAAGGAALVVGVAALALLLVRRRRKAKAAVAALATSGFAHVPAGSYGLSVPPWQGQAIGQPNGASEPHGSAREQQHPATHLRSSRSPVADDEFFAGGRRRQVDSGTGSRAVAGSLDPPAAAVPLEVGWHPAEDDPYILRYWNGTSWTDRVRWDGTEWKRIEDDALPPPSG